MMLAKKESYLDKQIKRIDREYNVADKSKKSESNIGAITKYATCQIFTGGSYKTV